MLMRSIYKAPKGLIRVELEVDGRIISRMIVTGDFFMVPEDALQMLERHMSGVRFEEKAVTNAVSAFYLLGMSTPMLKKEDFIKAIMGAKNEG